MDVRELTIAMERCGGLTSEIMNAACAVAAEAALLSDGVRLTFKRMPIFSSSSPSIVSAVPADKSAVQDKMNVIDRILALSIILENNGVPNGAMSIQQAVQKVLTNGYRTSDNFSKDVDDPQKMVNDRAMGNIVLLNLRANRK